MSQGRKIESLEELKKELESLVQSLRYVHDAHARALLITKFKAGLIELRRGALEL